MTTVFITGYKAFELGLSNDKDIRVKVIKAAIRRDLLRYLEEGVDWFIFSGNLGFEYWALEIAKGLQEEYGCKLATIFPFENHGENWNEANQVKLADFKQVDFVKYAYTRYENPQQFRDYNQFLVSNSDQAYVFYDEERESNLKYLWQMMKEQEDYPVKRLSFDDLNEVAETFSES